METSTTLESIQSKVENMQGDISQILAHIETESKKKKKKEVKIDSPPPPRPKVTKEEAAGILTISTRQLQRVRKKFKLKWAYFGRESYYYLDTIVEAITMYDLPWNPTLFEKIKSRIKTIPEL